MAVRTELNYYQLNMCTDFGNVFCHNRKPHDPLQMNTNPCLSLGCAVSLHFP